jgi:hypothetical protein
VSLNNTAAVTAKQLGLSTRQLSRLVEMGMPRVGAGRKARFGPEALQWHREYLARQGATGRSVSALARAQARKLTVDADRSALKLERERGKLLDADRVLEVTENAFSNVRVRMRGLAKSMAPILAANSHPAEVERMLLDAVDGALESLSTDVLKG